MSLEPAGAQEIITGLVLEIQRMSTEDGPGIRPTVFLKGCPLRCIWCHNPEGLSPKPQVIWIES
ncbi:MAG: 4Fe-4S cluster-binding domain-containing protein, partial [Pseudomonadota bacterium]